MTITPTTLYWILMLDNINNAFGILAVASIFLSVGAIIGTLAYNAECNSGNELSKKQSFFFIFTPPVLGIICLMLATFIPNTKQMATIIVAPKLINSNFVQKDLPKEAKELYGMAKSYLKEQITENKVDK